MTDDVLTRADPWLKLCGTCDAGLPVNCTCPAGDPRPVIADLVNEVGRLRRVCSGAPLGRCQGFVAAHGFGKARTCRCGADYAAHPVRVQ